MCSFLRRLFIQPSVFFSCLQLLFRVEASPGCIRCCGWNPDPHTHKRSAHTRVLSESSDYQSFYNGIYYSYYQTYLSVLMIERRKWQKNSHGGTQRTSVCVPHCVEGKGECWHCGYREGLGGWGRKVLLLPLSLLPCRLLAACAAPVQRYSDAVMP